MNRQQILPNSHKIKIMQTTAKAGWGTFAFYRQATWKQEQVWRRYFVLAGRKTQVGWRLQG